MPRSVPRAALAAAVVLVFCGLFAAAPAWAQSPPGAPAGPSPVALTSEINGDLAVLRCHGDVPRAPLAQAAAQAAAYAPSVVVDTGNLIGATAVSRLAVEHDARGLADVVAAGGWRALVVGHRDLAALRATLLTASAAFARRGIRYVLSNLRCAPAGRAVCDAVLDATDAPLVLDAAGARVAVVAAIAPSWLRDIARDRAAGLALDEPAAALTRAAQRARAAGATRVIAVYDPSWPDAAADGLALAGSLPRGVVDALVVNALGSRLRTGISGGASSVPIAGARAGAVVLVPTREPAAGEGTPADTPDAQPAEPSAQIVAAPPVPRAPVPPALAAYETATTEWLCRDQDRPIRGEPAAVISADEMAALLLDVMRDVTRSEVAIINRGAVRTPDDADDATALTRLAITTALPFDNFVRRGRVRGSVLAALARSDRAASFYLRGITREGDSVRINGRSVDEDLDYAVVTTDFIAEGGDGGLGGDAATVRLAPFGTESMREVLLRWLDRPPPPGAVAPPVPIDPSRRTRWRLRLSLDFGLQSVTIANPAPGVFIDPQLSRSQLLSLRGEGEVRVDGDHPDYTIENTLRLLYGASQVVPVNPPPAPGTPLPALQETADLITGRSTAAWRTGRRGRPEWYEPLPYLDAYLESEFTRQPAPRNYHHLELRPSVGTRFVFNDRFYLYFGVGFSWEILARPTTYNPDGSIATNGDLTPLGSNFVPTVVAGWALRPGVLFSLGRGRDVTAESNLDVLFRAPAGMLLRGRVKVSVPLFEPVALTLTYDLFYRYVGAGLDQLREPIPAAGGFAGDLTIGLKVTFARALQAFIF